MKEEKVIKEKFIRKESNRMSLVLYKKKWIYLTNKQKNKVNNEIWKLGD